LDRELASGVAALRSWQPSQALLSSVQCALEAQLLNQALEQQETTPSGVRVRPAIEVIEPSQAEVEPATAARDPSEPFLFEVRLPPARWRSIALSAAVGALVATLALCIAAYRAGEVSSEALQSTAARTAAPRAGRPSLGSGSGTAAYAAGSLPASSDVGAQPAPDPAKLALGSGRGQAALRAKNAAAERQTIEPAAVRLEEALEPAPAALARKGVLNINSIPLSKIVLDGRPIGGTPRVQVPVVPGYHTVVFIHSVRGRIEKQVHVEAGRTVLAAVRFE
jgi:hypothetical protein